MSPNNHSGSSRILNANAVLFGLAASLGLAACGVDAGADTDSSSPSAEDVDSPEPADAPGVADAAKATSGHGQEMGYENWFYCRHVSYLVQIQYWYNLSYTGIILGDIHADQYGPTTGIDYTVQIKSVHDNHHVWWSRTGTSSGPHLDFPASSTPSTVYPLSWEPYVRLYLGVDGDGLSNCNFDADLD